MKVICPGWVEPKHDCLLIREKEPIEDRRISHGMCADCEMALLAKDAKEEAKWV